MSSHDVSKYSVNVVFSGYEKEYIARCPEFPGLTGFGQTHTEAIADLQSELEVVVDIYEKDGTPIPAPRLEEDDEFYQ